MNNELKHYGRKGQHWGIRNGPPYPLSRQYTKAELRSLYSSKSGKRTRKGSTLDETGSSGSGEASDKKTTRAEIKRIKAEIKLERAKAKTAEIEAKREQENRRIQEEAARKAEVDQQKKSEDSEVTRKKKEQEDNERIVKNAKLLAKNPKNAANMTKEELEEVYQRVQKEKNILDTMLQENKARKDLKKMGPVKKFINAAASDIIGQAAIPTITGFVAFELYKAAKKKIGKKTSQKDADDFIRFMFQRTNNAKRPEFTF